ncbi:MAG: transposase [Verrucomicrobia bacterium]|nr:transposase [Verrucomicrobiota bacterium]
MNHNNRKRSDEQPIVGQTSGLPVPGVSDSEDSTHATGESQTPTGIQRGPEPSGRRPDPETQPSPFVSGVHSRGALPHLKREGASYFVTFRLADTLPREVLLRLKREREAILEEALAHNRPLTWHEQKDLFNWYSDRVDKYLDAGHGDCWLSNPAVAELVANAVRYFEGKRYTLHAWVVMPNHAHVVVHPTPPHTLSAILKSWKTYTAVHANRLLGREGQTFWQSESYDHCCRDDDDLARCCAYTTMNPVNARLCARPDGWRWSSLHVGQSSALPVAGTSGSQGQEPDPAPSSGLRSKPEPSDRRSDPQHVPGRPNDGQRTR